MKPYLTVLKLDASPDDIKTYTKIGKPFNIGTQDVLDIIAWARIEGTIRNAQSVDDIKDVLIEFMRKRVRLPSDETRQSFEIEVSKRMNRYEDMLDEEALTRHRPTR